MFAKVGEEGVELLDEQKILKAIEKKALGFSFDEIVEEYSQDENGNSVLCKRKITKKVNPPDLTALKFLLEEGEISDISKMTDKQLLEEKQRLLKLLKENEEKHEDGDV